MYLAMRRHNSPQNLGRYRLRIHVIRQTGDALTQLPLHQRLRFRASLLVDDVRGLDFLRNMSATEAGLDPALAYRSSPSLAKPLRAALRGLDINADDRIIDVGCGKGAGIRSLLRFPFALVHGVELSEQLASIAVSNFRRLRDNRVQIFHADARTFSQFAAYNYAYLYNPFPDSVLREFLSHWTDAHMQSVTRIIYNNPVYADELMSFGFQMIHSAPGAHGNGICVYEK